MNQLEKARKMLEIRWVENLLKSKRDGKWYPDPILEHLAGRYSQTKDKNLLKKLVEMLLIVAKKEQVPQMVRQLLQLSPDEERSLQEILTMLTSGGVTPEQFTIAGKIIAKAAELGHIRFQEVIQWAIVNIGPERMKEDFNAFKAAYTANISINNPQKEDLNEIASLNFSDFESMKQEKLKKNQKDVKGRLALRLELALKDYRPSMYRELREAKKLDQYLLDQQDRAYKLIDQAIRQGYSLLEAEEIANSILMEAIEQKD